VAEERIEIEIVLDDGSIKKGFAKIQKQGKGTGKKLTNVFDKFTSNLKSKLLGLGAVFAGAFLFRRVIKNLIEFEEALAEIDTISGNLTQTNKGLADSLILLSAQFGTSASEQAKSFYQIISAGITDATRANQLLIASNKLAIGGLATQAESVDILTSAVNSFGQENISSEKAADILFATVRLGKTRITDLASSLGQVLPSAAALKISFEEVGGAVAQLTTKGLSTSEAVTQLQAVFTALLRKQGQAKIILGENADAFSLQALQVKGLTKFLKDLNGELGGSEEKLVKLLGRVEGAKAILSLGADGFEGLGDKIKQLQNSSGAADEAFQRITNTLNFQLKVAVSTIDAIFLNISKTVGGPLVTALKTINIFLLSIATNIGTFGLEIENAFTKFSISVNKGLLTLLEFQNKVQKVFSGIREFIREVGTAIGLTFGTDVEDPFIVSDEQVELLRERLAGLRESLEINKDEIVRIQTELADALKDTTENNVAGQITSLKKLNTAFNQVLARGISTGIQNITNAVIKGKNAFEALGKNILSVIGDLAIFIGQFLIATSLAKIEFLSADPTGGLAVGAGLVALGAVLKSIGGAGGLTGGAGAGATGAVDAVGVATTDIADDEDVERGTMVTINVEGTILDPVGTATQIAELLTEITDSNDIVVNA